MKKFLSVLLSILFAVVFFGTVILGIGINLIKPSTITNMAGELFKPVAYFNERNLKKDNYLQNENGLFYPDEWNVVKTVQYDIPEGIDLSDIDLTNLDLNELIASYGKEYGLDLDSEFIAEVLSDESTAALINTYSNEIINYIAGNTTELKVDAKEIEKVVNKTIDRYEEKTGETVDRTGLSEIIQESIDTAVPEITKELDNMKEDNAEDLKYLKLAKSILSQKTLVICIIICICLFVLLILLNKNFFVALKFISIPLIVDGLLILTSGISCTAGSGTISEVLFNDVALSKSITDFIIAVLSKIFSVFTVCGAVISVTGVVTCVLGFVLGKNKKA